MLPSVSVTMLTQSTIHRMSGFPSCRSFFDSTSASNAFDGSLSVLYRWLISTMFSPCSPS